MNKKLILIAILLFVILGIGGYLVASKKTTTTTNNEVTQQGGDQNPAKSLKDLLALGSSQECNFSDADGNKGTVYVSSGKMRGKFTTKTSEQTSEINSNIMVDGKTSYMWIDGQPTGYKVAIDAEELKNNATLDAQNFDLDKDINFNCKGWVVDVGAFSLPTNVKFMDLGEITIPAASGNSKAMQCSTCDSVPESARAQCKTALGCN